MFILYLDKTADQGYSCPHGSDCSRHRAHLSSPGDGAGFAPTPWGWTPPLWVFRLLWGRQECSLIADSRRRLPAERSKKGNISMASSDCVPDLFADPPRQGTDSWYAAIRDKSRFVAKKEHILEMWRFYYTSGLHDPEFKNEFPTQFHHRWWELEVAWFLHQRGFDLTKPPGPDLLCKKDDIEVYVEAVVPEPGNTDSPDYPKPAPFSVGNDAICATKSISLPEQERLELLRLTNSIESKVDQYHRYCAKQRSDASFQYNPQVPFVIALSPAMIPDMLSDMADSFPAIIKAVYPVGQIYLSIDCASGEAIGGGRTYRPNIQKSNKAHVSTSVFLPSPSQERYAGISGILYNPCSPGRTIGSYARRSHPFDFVHNFVSRNRLRVGCFGENMDYWFEEGDGVYEMKNNIQSPQGAGPGLDVD